MFPSRMCMVGCFVPVLLGALQVDGKSRSEQHNLVERAGSDWWRVILKIPNVDAIIAEIANLPSHVAKGLKSLCENSGSVCQTVTNVMYKFKSFPGEIISKITSICSHDLTTCTMLASKATPLASVPLSILSNVLELCDGSPQTCVDQITRLIMQQDVPLASVAPAPVPPASVPSASVPPASGQAPRPHVQPTRAVSSEGGNTTVKPLESEGDSKPPPHYVPTTGPHKKDANFSHSPNGASPTRRQRFPHAVLMACVILLGYFIFQ
ncbi:unnamed protein product [Lymnaea stagnalis]|uniref:Uncharacterized protein n=1 Tax=Lymnaea stagnalis TaxID=6523 RepID=A0AAV2HAA2_LYMST